MHNLTSEIPRPTKVRYLVVSLAALMAVLLYLDRFCVSYLITFAAEELGLNEFQAYLAVSIFFLTYALGQVPCGWLSDRFGARLMLAIYILFWSLFTGLLGLATSFFMLLVVRSFVGIGQAGAYPTSAGMVSKWVPFSARATASSIVSIGGRIGGFLAPLLTPIILVMFFVPLSTPVSFSDTDFLNVSAFVDNLQVVKKPTDEGKKKSKRQLQADAEAKKLAAKIENQLTIPFADLAKLNPEAQREKLQKALNDLLTQNDLGENINLAHLSLSREAEGYFATPADQLSDKQIQRRNRLLLETAFPKYLKKLYVHGWRPVAIVYGLAGLVVAGLFYLGVRNRPQQHPLCNKAEQDLIEGGRPTSSPYGKVDKLPLKYIVRSRSLWLSSISQFGTNFGWVFLVVMLPSYLYDAHDVPPILRGVMASAPILVGSIGMFCGGIVTDLLTRRIGLRWGRSLPMSLTRFLALGAFVVCLFAKSPWVFVAAFCAVAVATDLGTAAVWAFKQDIGGRNVGSILGWGNMWGNFAAFLSPPLLGLIQGPYKWELRFIACAIAFGISGIAALGIDARVPVVKEEGERESEPS